MIFFLKYAFTDLAAPLIWQSDKWKDWFFEEQNNLLSWTEYKYYQKWDEYSNITKSKDSKGFPVIIMNNKDGQLVKLTQLMSYWGSLFISTEFELVTGYWVTKRSISLYSYLKDLKCLFYC